MVLDLEDEMNGNTDEEICEMIDLTGDENRREEEEEDVFNRTFDIIELVK